MKLARIIGLAMFWSLFWPFAFVGMLYNHRGRRYNGYYSQTRLWK